MPVERTERHTDTLYRAMWHTDTVIDRDTIKTFVRQDSAVTEIIRWRWRVRERHDTVHRTDTDSVYVEKPYPVEVVKEVDKPLSWWQKTLMWIGAGIITCVLFALGKRLYLKFR